MEGLSGRWGVRFTGSNFEGVQGGIKIVQSAALLQILKVRTNLPGIYCAAKILVFGTNDSKIHSKMYLGRGSMWTIFIEFKNITKANFEDVVQPERGNILCRYKKNCRLIR